MRVYKTVRSIDILPKQLAFACALAMPLAVMSSPVKAEDVTAGTIMTKMTPEERNAYLFGVIEGFGYARYLKDGKAETGIACINRWFAQADTRAKIHSAFTRFGDYMPGAVMAALIEKECGA